MPVFAIFFPVELAVALTAVVHLANNLFKLFLVGRKADKTVLLRFGLPAVLAAVAGARSLLWFSHLQPVVHYQIFGQERLVMPVKLVVAALMIFCAFLELGPAFEKISFDKKYLPVGGALSGFFGGLSGHQGAFRSDPFCISWGISRCAAHEESHPAGGPVPGSGSPSGHRRRPRRRPDLKFVR